MNFLYLVRCEALQEEVPKLLPLCGVRSPTIIQLFGLMSNGQCDPAARRSLLDLPTSDLPCQLSSYYPTTWLEAGSSKVALPCPTHQYPEGA